MKKTVIKSNRPIPRPVYTVGTYRDTTTGLTRIGVFAEPSNVWYFPKTKTGKEAYGWKAAERLAKQLKRQAKQC